MGAWGGRRRGRRLLVLAGRFTCVSVPEAEVSSPREPLPGRQQPATGRESEYFATGPPAPLPSLRAPAVSTNYSIAVSPSAAAYIGYRMDMRRQIVSTWKWVENNKSPLGNPGSVAACTSPPLPALSPLPPRSPPSLPLLGFPGQGSVTPSLLSDVRRRSQVCVFGVGGGGSRKMGTRGGGAPPEPLTRTALRSKYSSLKY